MFRELCALKVTGTRFYVSGHGARKYFGGPEFFLIRVFRQIFCDQNEENISHQATTIIIWVMHLLTKKIQKLPNLL